VGAALRLIVALAGIDLVGPYLTKVAIDRHIATGDAAGSPGWPRSTCSPSPPRFAVRFGQNYVMQMTGQRVMQEMRREIFAHLQRLHVGYFDRNPVGRLMTRVTTDVDAVNELFTSGVVTVFGDLFTLLGIMAVMLALDWRLALVTFAVIPLFFALTNWFRKGARQSFRETRRSGWPGSTPSSRRTSPACRWCSCSGARRATARPSPRSTAGTTTPTCRRSSTTRSSTPRSSCSPPSPPR
jgi:ATP-binding cassette, subfamily B, multidrug efflux pump